MLQMTTQVTVESRVCGIVLANTDFEGCFLYDLWPHNNYKRALNKGVAQRAAINTPV